MKWGFHLQFWNTIADLTTVALGSSKSETCYKASAESSTVGLFKEPVRLHMERDGRLQVLLNKESL
jgi:hypothetical protein